MDFRLFSIIFGSVFLAELGDKTQIATVLFASESSNPAGLVFLASAAALIASSAFGVLFGSVLSEFLDPKVIGKISGVIFILIGITTFLKS